MTDNLITWNIRNWVTVFFMFLAAWAIIAVGARFLKARAG